ncbi:MAG: cadherin-like domain-containing protein [Chitinophagales bacterium]|nr:cadherin-like domain-containing protein [Chitinophagales bacterium]
MHTFCLRHFEALGLRRVLLPLLCAACCWTATNQTALIAQCISSTPQDDIGCDTGPVTLHASLPSYMSGLNSTIFWAGTSPLATGTSYTFAPNCAALGEKSFTPCLPAGSNIPARSFTLGPFSATIPVGGINIQTFTVSDICFQQGVSTYTGNLLLTVSGNSSDLVEICLTLPSGTQICTGGISVGTIQGLGGSIPISLLQLTEPPNGTWTVEIRNLAGNSGPVSYNLAASTITVPAYTTTTAICADPVEFFVFGGCPAFISAQANQTAVCSGTAITLSATLNPAGAPNVTYSWTGPNGFASSQANPSITLSNTTCDPQTLTYRLQTLTCTNNGSVITSNQNFNVTVYPELTLADVIIDNTTNIQDPDCSITVSVACPNFTVNGQIGQNTTDFLPGDNGTQGEFIISNGLASCNLVVTPPITCLSNCNPPVATATAVCQGSNQFNINVSVTAFGDASSYTIIPSQGSALTINAAGNYTFGPYPNNTSVNIKILNDVDVNCNLNLGNIQQTCKICPELLTATASGSGNSRCAGDAVTFTATVTAGAQLNTDYRIQWQLNGVNIGGATGLTYNRTLTSSDYCAAESQVYTAVVTCLNGGTPAAVSTLTAATLSVYNRPRFGVEFTTEACSAMPIDNCNDNLTITNGGAANPAPGSAVTVNYSASITGAPAGCAATGSFTAGCPSCNDDDPGSATTTAQTVCWGNNFSISSAGALVIKPGFVVGLAVSTQPITNVSSTTDLQSKADVAILGPFNSPGTINPAQIFNNNGINLPQPTSTCGQTYFFTPFLSFRATSGFKQDIEGTYTAVGDGIGCNGFGSLPVPGIGGGVSTVSGVPFCAGLTTYNISYNSVNTDGYNINPNSCEVLGNQIPNGGINSNFPNINACQTGLYTQNNWTQDPNGENISNTIVIVPLTPLACDQTGHVDWDLTVFLNETYNFPTICPSCNSLGESEAVTILPNVTIANVAAPTPICSGQSFDLSTLNPAPTPATGGTYHWYEGNPNSGAPELTSTVVSPASNTMYCVDMEFCDNGTCRTPAKCFTLTVLGVSSLNDITPAPICPGESVDLTAFNDLLTGQSGTFQWFVGNPDAATPPAGALIADPTNVTPIGSERYYVRYVPSNGCAATSYIQFSYHPIPILLAAAPESCSGQMVNLRDNQTALTTDAGTFQWYNGDPDNGGVALGNTNNAQPVPVTPTNGSTYYVLFTNAATGCSAEASITYTVNPLPTISTPTPTPVCVGTAVNLTLLQAQVTTAAGTFAWFTSNPTFGGVAIPDPTAFVPTNEPIYVEFTDQNGCRNNVGFTYPTQAAPALNTVAAQNLCAAVSPATTVINLPTLNTQFSNAANLTFTWYNGNPAAGGTLLNASNPNNDPANQTLANGQSRTYYVVVSNALGCTSTGQVTYNVYAPVSGITASYNCTTGLQVNFTNALGGSGAGYHVATSSPNQNGQILAHDTDWTIIVEDGSGCDQTTALTGTVDCPICDAGAAGTVSNSVLCCDESVTINNPTANITETNRFTLAWGLSPFADGAIINTDQVQTAADAGWVYQASPDNSLTLTRDCFEGSGTIPPGRYYATPFISKVPPQLGPPDPIIFDPANNCDPYAQLCPTFSGDGWTLFPMLVTLPNGTTINVAEVVTAALLGAPANVPINQALLNSIPQLSDLDGDGNNDIPCIALSTLYNGDPNGTWTISFTNTGTGALNFNIPDFEVSVSADSCTLITEDQISFVNGISGTVVPGQTLTADLIIPSPQVSIPVITYDPANNCDPYAALCPTIGGSGWEICEFFIQFPEGDPVNVIETATAALTGSPLNVCITQSFLNGIPQLPDLNSDGNNDLPCIPLGLLYNGNPNGEWCFRVNNTGSGTLQLNLPDFELSVSADSCTLISADEVYVVEGLNAIIPGNTDTTICINVPSLPTLFPSVSDECSDYGTPAVVTVLDDISYTSVTGECANETANVYVVHVQGLHGGAPGVIAGATYQFPSAATYNSATDTYTFTTTINSFPYSFNINSSSANGPSGAACNGIQGVLANDPCICIPPVVSFSGECIDDNTWQAKVILSQLGSSATYTLQDNQGSTAITGIAVADTFYIGTYANLSMPTLTLVSVADADCNTVFTYDGTIDCSECSAGSAVALANNIICCDQTAHISLVNDNVKEDLDIIGWAVAPQPIESEADLDQAILIEPGNADFSYDLNNDCQLPAGNYFVTPFISRAAGDAIELPIPYDPAAGCIPNALLAPTVNCPAAWGINPIVLHYPDGTSEDLLIAVGQPGLVGTVINCTLWDVVDDQGLLPLSTNAIYDGDPNGTWCIEITNVGTDPLVFSLPDFEFTVNCQGQTLTYPIQGTSGTIPPDAQAHQICFEVNAGTIIPNFPEIDPLCTDFGDAIPVTLVNDLNFDFALSCHDANNDGLTDSYEATISNITGGAPGVVSGASYQLPAGYTDIGSGFWRSILPLSVGNSVSVTVGSTANGAASCEATRTAEAPTDCPTSCGFNAAVGSNCLPSGGYEILVNVLSVGTINSSYRVKVNGTNTGAPLTAAAPTVVLGPYANGSTQTIAIEGIQFAVCDTTVLVNPVCVTCNGGTATAATALLCEGDSTVVSTAGSTVKPGNIISYIIAPAAADDSTDIANATRVVPSGSGGSYTLQNDGSIPAGVYQVTPFISQPAGAPVCPQIPYNPAAGCVPNGGIMPGVGGTGWIIDPLILTFPDGTSKTIFEAIGQASLEGTPITPNLWQVVQSTPGVLPLQMTTLFSGNPNGEWCLTATNVGTGDLQFFIEDLVVSVTCDGVTQSYVIEGVSGTVAAGTTQDVCFTISAGACFIPDFPAYSDDCYDFGTPAQVVLTDAINYTLNSACYDANTDGVADGYSLTISNITGGAPQFTAATYTLPAGFTPTGGGTYTLILPAAATGTQTVSVGSSNAADCAVEKSIPLPTNCQFTPCTPPTGINADGVCNGSESFSVSVQIIGGSGNTSYTLSGGGQTITTTGNSGVLGPFAFGTPVTVTATGVQFADCSLTDNETLTMTFDDCTSCQVGIVTLSNNAVCCGEGITFDYDEATSILDTNSIISYALATAPITDVAGLEGAISTTNVDENNMYVLENECDLTPGTYYVTPFIAQVGAEPICPEIPYDPDNGCIPNGALYPNVTGTDWILNPLLIHFPDGTTKTIFDAVGQPLLNGTPITPALWGVAASLLPLQLNTLFQGDPSGEWCIEATNVGTGTLTFSIADFVINDTCDGQIYSFPVEGITADVPGGTTTTICFEVSAGECEYPDGELVCPEIPYDPDNGCIPDADIYPDAQGTDWILNPLLIQLPDGTTKTIFDAVGQPLLNGTPITPALWGVAQSLLPLKLTTLYNGDPNGTWCLQATNVGTGDLYFSIADFVINDTCDGQILSYNIAGVSDTVPGGQTVQICFEVNGGECYYEQPTTVDEDCSDFGQAIPVYLLDDMSYVTATVACNDPDNNLYTITVDGLTGGAPGIVPDAAYTFPATASQVGSTYQFNAVITQFPYSFVVGNTASDCSLSIGGLAQPNCSANLPPVIEPNIALGGIDNGGAAVTINLLNFVSDPNGDPVVLTNVEQPTMGGTLTFEQDGTVTFTPDEGFTGDIVIVFTVADVPAGATSTGTFTLTLVDALACADLAPLTISNFDYNKTTDPVTSISLYSPILDITGGLPTYDPETGYIAIIDDGTNQPYEAPLFAIDSDTYYIPDLVSPSSAFMVTITIYDELGCSQSIMGEVTVTVAVSLLHFDGEVMPEGNLLRWATATETNSHHFTLQRATDGINFVSIATRETAGNSHQTRHYNHIDKTAKAGLNYYRLLETDLNGNTRSVGQTITLLRDAVSLGITDIAPVPATDFVTIGFNAVGSQAVRLQLYDVTGRLVYAETLATPTAGANLHVLNLRSVASGVYFVTLSDGSHTTTGKVVKQ